jgi:hypothetical protein
MKASEIEIAIANHFNYRQNLIVPNVCWGMGLHECDLLILTKSNYAYEIEIKVSKQDLIKDLNKAHKHESKKIKYLWFAVPDKLMEFAGYIPKHAGILKVEKRYTTSNAWWYKVTRERWAETKSKYKWSSQERYELARLGALRIWDLKKNINKLRSKANE